MEKRIFGMRELRAENGDDGPVIEGYAAVFNVRSLEMWGFQEIILPGAFADSIASDDIRSLWNHDTSFVLGRTRNGTLSLHEDEVGLRVRIQPPDTQFARDFVESIRRGDVDQMSFAFEVLPDGEEWERDDEERLLRKLKKVTLYEVSPVTFPAYPATSVSVREQWGDPVEIPAHLLEGQEEGDEAERQRARARLQRLQLELKRLRI